MAEIKAGETYELIRMSRWGKSFHVDKIAHGVVCGRFKGDGALGRSQGACYKLDEFQKMVKDDVPG